MDKAKIYLAQGFLAVATATFTAKMGILAWVLIILLILMISDYASGMGASAKEAIENPEDKTKGWNSNKGRLGILKKFSYVLVIGVAVAVDLLIYKVGAYMNFDMPGSTFFGLVIAMWYIFNEMLSILENCGRMGAKVPAFFKSAIMVLKNKVDSNGGNNDGE